MTKHRILSLAGAIALGMSLATAGAFAQAWTTGGPGDLVTTATTSRVGILTATPGATLDVNGSTNISNILTVGGMSNFQDGNFNLNLNVNQDLNVNQNLNVNVDANFNHDVNVQNRLQVNLDAFILNDLTVHHNLAVDNDVTVAGYSSFGQDATFNNNVYVTLDAWASNYYTWSDARLKENITPMTNVLAKLEKIQPVYYNYNNVLRRPEGRQLGFIAQEIQKEFPEAVQVASNGYLAVGYGNMAAVAIEAVKEQQKTITDQRKTIEQLQATNGKLTSTTEQLAAANADLAARLARLEAAVRNLTGCCPEPGTAPNLK